MTYQTLNLMAVEKLTEAEIADPVTDARKLLLFVTGMTYSRYAMRLSESASAEEEETFQKLLAQRCRHVPLQQITGQADFMGHVFRVNSHVLIPRFDTETLVYEVIRQMKGREKILDIGTGSGCILCSILYAFPDAEGTGVDISREALINAEENAAALGIRRAHFLESDFFTNVSGTYDIIVSNPPYIESDAIRTLDPEVKDFEPLTALDGGQDGLYCYRRITEETPSHLADGGMLFYEIGAGQAAAVRKIMESHGFRDVRVVQDLSGRDRVVFGGKDV